MSFNFKNLSENLIIIIVAGLLGGVIGYVAAVKSHKVTVAQLKPVVEKAIDKETIKNEIKNEISIAKIKKSDSIKIVLEPINNQKPVNIISKKKDSCIPVKLLSIREIKKLKRKGVIK